MTDKAYIVANEEQELRVLNEFEKRGYCWINDQGKPISSGVLIARELEDYPLFIGERFETKTIYWQDLSKLVNEDIVFDGRKEEHMSEKYVVSQEFMNMLKKWKDTFESSDYVSISKLDELPMTVEYWRWVGDEKEKNNRLITIIRWVNGEDVFEVKKPKKWVVRSKDSNDVGEHRYLRVTYTFSINHAEAVSDVYATKFDTREEAESWANSHQEVIEVEE